MERCRAAAETEEDGEPVLRSALALCPQREEAIAAAAVALAACQDPRRYTIQSLRQAEEAAKPAEAVVEVVAQAAALSEAAPARPARPAGRSRNKQRHATKQRTKQKQTTVDLP